MESIFTHFGFLLHLEYYIGRQSAIRVGLDSHPPKSGVFLMHRWLNLWYSVYALFTMLRVVASHYGPPTESIWNDGAADHT